MFACLYAPDFLVQSALLPETGDAREALRHSPIVVLDGPASLLKVVALNRPARTHGLDLGMTKLQVEACGGITQRKRCAEHEDSAHAVLLECAQGFSPRVESTCLGIVTLDLAGTEKLFGNLESTARKISANADERGLQVLIGIASNPDTALYAAQGFSGITVIPSGQEAQWLAELNISLLPIPPEMLETLDSWGIRTFQALSALHEVPLNAR